MPKLYVISDVHGFYDEMIDALDKAGFDPSDENSWLVVCGDTTDRGPKPREVIDYLSSLQRCVLVQGNHEGLLMDCINRTYPMRHDWSNGTAQTIVDLAPHTKTFKDACMVAYEIVGPFVDKMVDYFETKNYIFVHSFVPLKCNDNLPKYYTKNRKFEIDPDWRHAHHDAWEAARWGNPYELAEQGFLPDKTLVFGHYHTSWPRCYYEDKPEFEEGADFSPYYGNGYIAIDGCCAYSGKVNVLVIEDDFLEEEHGV